MSASVQNGKNMLTGALRADGEYLKLIEALKAQNPAKKLPMLLTGLCDGAAEILCAATLEDLPDWRPALLLCSEEKDCIRLRALYESFGVKSVFFPARDLNLHSLIASREYERARISALSVLLEGGAELIVTTPDAFLGYTIPPELLRSVSFTLKRDTVIDPSELEKRLVRAGYVRSDLAEGPGQFARRGGIIDIVTDTAPDASADMDSDAGRGVYAVRIEFFGDEIDRIGHYDSATQRVIDNVDSFSVPPAREVICDRAKLEAIKGCVQTLLKKTTDGKSRQVLEAELSNVSAAIDGGMDIPFSDKYISLIYPEKATLADYIPDCRLIMINGNSAAASRMNATLSQLDEDAKNLTLSGLLPGKYADFSKTAADFDAFLSRRSTLLLDIFGSGLSDRRLGGSFGFAAKHSLSAVTSDDMLFDDVDSLTAGGYRVILLCRDSEQTAHYLDKLTDGGIVCRASEKPDGSDIPFSLLRPGTVVLLPSAPVAPFELVKPKVAVMSVADKAQSALKTKRDRKKSSAAKRILSFNDLHVGDYVVHENHGIGRYDGISTLTVDGVTRDYITIQYAGSDRLFLPTEALDKVSKYIGARSDTDSVRLSKFGGAEWGRTKARAKSALRDIAKELIKLYAERSRRPGYAFSPDDSFQRDFENSFEYEETDAQREACNEIKQDMMRAVPMDRLLCGDVGYGKTEVALRAAYKAILDGKQVALLVPTTILALQHFRTAEARMRDTAVNVAMLSRFVKPKEQKSVIAKLKKGDVDLVIGTHRLLSKDIEFRDLGLLIVDEEQRFGVAQKEKIKQRSDNIDVLSLSATPIPRTLNMAMSGIRDISILDEAPGARQPVQTYVLEHNDLIIIEAIRRELRRGGQVFYLYNYIDSIDHVAGKLREAIPDAVIVTAHGKMDKDMLEDIWRDMTEGRIDILVSTTIIESGVDVPNANTLIVQNAHRFGLSQLHQLRGRVGRSPRRAYAYFTFPPNMALDDIQTKRLEAIREYAEFGAGFQIAMRDLELRGAGNVLGAEQSGHLDAIGYDLYVKLLGEAVLEEKGEKPAEEQNCAISLKLDAFIPDSYVPSAPQRMALYKRLAHVSCRQDADDIIDELEDRFGEPPKAVLNITDIALLRAEAAAAGITGIAQQGREVRITQEKTDVFVWQDMQKYVRGRMKILLNPVAVICLTLASESEPAQELLALVERFAKLKKENEQ